MTLCRILSRGAWMKQQVRRAAEKLVGGVAEGGVSPALAG